MFFRGPAQPALGRPQDRFSAAGSCASCSCASCVLQGAARPPSLAELIFRLHSVACLSSLGPTVLFEWFSSFPDADANVCVCVCEVFARRSVDVVSWGFMTAGTPTARCSRGGRIDSLITLRHWCCKTLGSHPIASLEGMSRTGFLPAK